MILRAGSNQGETSSEAKSDDTNRTRAIVSRSQPSTCAIDVIEWAPSLTIQTVKCCFDTPHWDATAVKVWSKGDIAAARESPCMRSHAAGHAKDIVDHHHAGPRSSPRRHPEKRSNLALPDGVIDVTCDNVAHWLLPGQKKWLIRTPRMKDEAAANQGFFLVQVTIRSPIVAWSRPPNTASRIARPKMDPTPRTATTTIPIFGTRIMTLLSACRSLAGTKATSRRRRT